MVFFLSQITQYNVRHWLFKGFEYFNSDFLYEKDFVKVTTKTHVLLTVKFAMLNKNYIISQPF